MVENIDRVLERGERIELLVDKTERLNQQAFKFEKSVILVMFDFYCSILLLYVTYDRLLTDFNQKYYTMSR